MAGIEQGSTEVLISNTYSRRSVWRGDDVNLEVSTSQISCEDY